jgi:threonine dehydratase
MTRLSLSLIEEAHARIRDKVNRTPVLTSESLNALSGASLFFKCENFQKVGAFKARGATNAVFCLTDEQAKRGVVTHSSGNHAAALARAAKLRGVPAYIVMPDSAPKAKVASVRRYGGAIVVCEPTLEARESNARRVVAETGAELIHPYDDLRVMAGQGTTAIELLEEVPDLDLILCPVGGGGLLSGVSVAAKGLKPGIEVVAVEPTAADDAARSFLSDTLVPSINPRTIADGLLTSLSERTFAEIREHVDDIVTVSEGGIARAMRLIWEVAKVIVEPSGAVPFAGVIEHSDAIRNKRVGLILTGGNLDLDCLPWMKSPQ